MIIHNTNRNAKCMHSTLVIILLCLFVLSIADEDEKVLAELEISDLELVDNFETLTIAKKHALISQNYRQKINKEQNFGTFMRAQAANFREYDSVPFEVIRNWTVLTNPGDTLLKEEDWSRIVSYSNANEELLNTAKVPCLNGIEGCVFNRGGYDSILEQSKDELLLRETWLAWQKLLLPSEEEFPKILDLVSEAATLNEQQDARIYWEYLEEQPDIVNKVEMIWSDILPLYQKLHKFVQVRVNQYYNITDNSTTMPVYLLGSNFGDDWSHIANIILPHPQLHYDINTYLGTKSVKNIFELSESMIKELSLQNFGEHFWNESFFNLSFCEDQILTFCSKERTEIMTCNKTSWKRYLDIFHSAMTIAMNNDDYLSYPRRSLRYSPLEEALKELGSLLAVENLPHFGILSESVFKGESETNTKIMTKLLLVALRLLPRMAYYYTVDKWRLQELENKSENLTESWWKLREEFQGVRGVLNDEPDYLGDLNIISNRPYLHKFLGCVLQFQILFYHRNTMTDTSNNIAKYIGEDENFLTLIRERSSNEWPNIVSLYYGIYEVSPMNLLDYFKPLENYLDNAPLKQEKISTTTTTTTTTPKPTTKKQINLGKIQEQIKKAAGSTILKQTVSNTLSNNLQPPKVSKVEQASSNDGPMYFGIGVLIGVVIVTIGAFIRKRVKKERRVRNRRFADNSEI